MTTPAAQPFRLTERCPHCHRPVGPKHRETCSGPAQRIADPDEVYLASLSDRCPGCDCPPGWKHRPGCVHVTGDAA